MSELSRQLKSFALRRSHAAPMRRVVIWTVFLLTLHSGWQFYRFADHFYGRGEIVARPPMVDGFLPIGSLMTLRYWLQTGHFDTIHPAGLVLFGAALLTALLLKKGFCGYICPVGTLSEALYKTGERWMGRRLVPPAALDIPLRAVKYLLLAFFLYIVLFRMTAADIRAFLADPYWKVADVKMLLFFTEATRTTLIVLAVLVLLSLPIRNFWCRYLCPYGALLGLLSLASPFQISRDEKTCIGCGRCARVCPAYLPVDRKKRIRSAECTGCLTCVSHCPARGALDMAFWKYPVPPAFFLLLFLAVFFGLIGLAMWNGHWQSGVTYEEYKMLLPRISHLGHP